MHFPKVLDSDRDKAAVKIHIENIESHFSRSNQDTQAIINALNAIKKITEIKQDDMLVSVLLNYIDEILEMISPRQ